MKPISKIITILLLLDFLVPHDATIVKTENATEAFQCGIYMAASSIPNAGFGIYTTRSILEGETAQPSAESPLIPLYDWYDQDKRTFLNTLNNYVWAANDMASFEAETGGNENGMSLGALCNYHTALKNLEPGYSEYDDTILNRFKDPGSGAISYHSGRNFAATRDIEAGEELFDDYGEEWLETRPNTFADFIPRKNDYENAVEVILRLHGDDADGEFKVEERNLSILKDVVSVFSERASSLVPTTMSDFDDLLEIIKGKRIDEQIKEDLMLRLARRTILKRDVEWIRTNGMCLEKIRQGPSTIPGAGSGAFAQVNIEAGDMISPVPIVNIGHKDALLIHGSNLNSDGDQEPDPSKPIGTQLIMNYCFGHMESQLILCPQTNIILINHCSNRESGNSCNGNSPNAKVRWSDGWDPTSDEWLKKSMEDILKETDDGNRGLSMEVIATTNIAPGDEIFIDYGENWEKAWNNHVHNWVVQGTDSYSPVKEFIANNDIRTTEEQKTNPYPNNILLVCYAPEIVGDEVTQGEGNVTVVNGTTGFTSDFEITSRNADSLPCDIKERNDESNEFKIQIEYNEHSFLVTNYPRDSIVLGMKPYSSDIHQKGVFRHFIEIDDTIFPESWKTLHA